MVAASIGAIASRQERVLLRRSTINNDFLQIPIN
jgi:hypothetical protein